MAAAFNSEVTLTAPAADGKSLIDWIYWTDVRITRSIDNIPSSFEMTRADPTPNSVSSAAFLTGSPVSIKLGDDLVFTGFIDRVGYRMSADNHTVTVSGRSKLQDLVDGSAFVPTIATDAVGSSTTDGGTVQFLAVKAVDLIKRFCTKNQINVIASSKSNPVIPQLTLNLGESAWEIIERIAAFANFLALDTPAGDLLLCDLSTTKAASGFTQGINLLAANVDYAVDELFHTYAILWSPVPTGADIASTVSNQRAVVTDDVVCIRDRRLFVIVEQYVPGMDLALLRGQWEKNRRIGRGQTVHVVADSWRDTSGKLWAPNTLTTCDIAACKWVKSDVLIGTVTYLRSPGTGTTCEVSLAPPYAYAVEPIAIINTQVDIAQAAKDSPLPSSATGSPSTPTTGSGGSQ